MVQTLYRLCGATTESHVFDHSECFLKVASVKKATLSVTIDKLRGMYSTHGLPDTIVTDNAAVFTSSEMKEFFSCNGIKHITSALYHRASNNLDERAVQTFKDIKRRLFRDTNSTIFIRLSNNPPQHNWDFPCKCVNE